MNQKTNISSSQVGTNSVTIRTLPACSDTVKLALIANKYSGEEQAQICPPSDLNLNTKVNITQVAQARLVSDVDITNIKKDKIVKDTKDIVDLLTNVNQSKDKKGTTSTDSNKSKCN